MTFLFTKQANRPSELLQPGLKPYTSVSWIQSLKAPALSISSHRLLRSLFIKIVAEAENLHAHEMYLGWSLRDDYAISLWRVLQ
jgi:hypothetical protein